MKSDLAEKYRLHYLLLVKEFIGEVEKGVSWPDLKPIILEMKKLDQYLECIDALVSAPSANYIPKITHTGQ